MARIIGALVSEKNILSGQEALVWFFLLLHFSSEATNCSFSSVHTKRPLYILNPTVLRSAIVARENFFSNEDILGFSPLDLFEFMNCVLVSSACITENLP